MPFAVTIIDDDLSDSQKISELISDLDDSGKFVPKICRDPVSFQVSDFSDLYIIDIDIPDRSGFELVAAHSLSIAVQAV